MDGSPLPWPFPILILCACSLQGALLSLSHLFPLLLQELFLIGAQAKRKAETLPQTDSVASLGPRFISLPDEKLPCSGES